MPYQSRLEIIIDSLTGERRLRSLQGQMNATERAGNSLKTVALAASGALAGLGAGMSLVSAIRTIGDFEQEMKTLQSVTRGSSQDMAKFSKQARELGATTRYGANQAAQAQKFLAQAGLEVNQVLAATPGVLQLAQAGMMDLGSAADLATDIMAQMGLGVSDLTRINDVLVKTSQSATTDVRQLGEAFSYAGPVASKFGLSLEDTAAALGVISSSGIKASRAGTGLLGILRQLANPTKESAEALASYGISLDEVDVSARGFAPVLRTLEEAGISAADAFTIFGSEAGSAAQSLISARDDFDDMAGTLDRVNGTAQDAAAIMSDSLNNALLGLQSALSEAALQGGESGLAGAFRNLIDYSTGVIQVFNGLEEEWAEANGKGQEFLATVREIASEFQEFATQFNLVAQDIVTSLGEADDYFTETLHGWDLLGDETVDSLSEGFRNLPANIKAMVEIATVELLVLVDKAKAYGEAIDKYLNPVNLINGAWDSIGENLDAQLAMVDQVRLDSISDILSDRERIVNAFEIEQEVDRQAKAIANLEDNALSFVASMATVKSQTESTEESLSSNTKAIKASSDETDAFAKSASALLDTLYPLEKSQREYAEQKQLLTRYAREEEKSNAWLEDSLQRLDQSYQNAGSAAEAYGLDVTGTASDIAAAADPMSHAWEEAADRIDETFSDAFAGAFDSFDDFSDQLLDGFKRLLGELAYQATLQPIVVGFTADAQNMLGIGGASGGSGGFTNTIAGAKQVWDTGSLLFGGGSSAASLGVAGGVSSTAITSANAVTAGSSGIMGTVGAAAPYVGAAMLADNVLGLGIMDGISGAIGSLFGGGKKKFGISLGNQTRNEDGYSVDSVLGNVGLAADNSKRSDADDWAPLIQQVAEAQDQVAQLLNEQQQTAVRNDLSGYMTYSLTSSDELREEQVQNLVDSYMGEVIRSAVKNSGSAFSDAILAEGSDNDAMYQELASALNLNTLLDGVSDNVRDYADKVAAQTSGDVQAALDSVIASITTNSLLADAADQLNLQFDALADGAIEAGNRIAELAGGVDSLSSTYSSYYQAVFSDNERLSDSYQSLGEQFDALGVEMPNNVDALRDLVESQALNTDESRKLQLQLMQLAPTFAETTSSVRDALTQQYQDILDRAPDTEGLNYWIDEIQSGATSLEHALASIANSAEATTAELKEIMQSASDAYESAMSQARDYLAGITNSLSEYLDQLHSTDAGLASPGDQLAAAAGAFSEQYQLALSGDRDALGSITQYASRLIDAQTQWSGSGTQTQDVIADITSKLEQLPERLSPEQFLADEIRDAITDGISDLTDGIATTIAGSFDAIDFNQDDVIDWSEFRRQFDGLVDNDTLRDIFGALDNNGNGVIDQLESDARAIEAWSSQQPESAQSAIQEMLDMYEEILGRQADLPGIDYYLDQYFDGMSLEEIRARLEDSPEAGSGGSSSGGSSGSSGSSGGGYTSGGSDAEGDPLLSDATGDVADAFRDVLGRDPDDSGYAYYQDQLNSGNMTLDEIRDRLADSPEANGYALGGAFVGGVQAFAKGGAFTNGIVTEPTLFDMAQMGEEGPEAIMPLSRGADGSLGVRAELPPLVIPPLASGGNTAQLERLLRDNNRLMQQNAELLRLIEQHGAAGVRVSAEGHRRQIAATEQGNRSLSRLESDSRLEKARA